MESGYALVGPDLSLAEADLGFQLAVKDFDFPSIQIRLDERWTKRWRAEGISTHPCDSV
jgi:hypothetical protein